MSDKQSLKDHLHAALMQAYDQGMQDAQKACADAADKAVVLAMSMERASCAAIARQWDAQHPDTNYGACIARLIEQRGQT